MKSPLRAVLASHAQVSFNRMRKQMGSGGVILTLIVAFFLVATLIVPVLFGFSAAGFALMTAAYGPEGKPELIGVLGALISGLSLFGGFIGGVTGGGKQLTWESYRQYPVQPVTLFFAELFAGFGDVVTLAMSVTLFATCCCAGLAVPSMLPGMVLLALESVLTLLALQLVIGSLADRLVRRLRLAIAVSFGMAWLISSFLGTRLMAAKTVELDKVKAGAARLLELTDYLPATRALIALHGGPKLGLAWGVVLLVASTALAFVLLWRERELSTPEVVTEQGKPWSFRHPRLGVARLQWVTLLGSIQGRFAFAMPLITIGVIKGPFSQISQRTDWMVPSAFIYLSLAANGLGFNQFGLDGHGVKTLFLLPLSERTILEGKQLGFALWQSIQALLLVGLLAVLQRPPVTELVAGLMLFIAFALVQHAVGQRTSVWFPRKLVRGMKSGAMPLPVVLLGLAVTFGGSGLLGGTYWLLQHLAPLMLVPGMTLAAAAAFAISRPVLGANADYLKRNRERIIDAVG
ncbi:MAG: hypothetical protein QM723_19445 [Myxococcaceae bacterium]